MEVVNFKCNSCMLHAPEFVVARRRRDPGQAEKIDLVSFCLLLPNVAGKIGFFSIGF